MKHQKQLTFLEVHPQFQTYILSSYVKALFQALPQAYMYQYDISPLYHIIFHVITLLSSCFTPDIRTKIPGFLNNVEHKVLKLNLCIYRLVHKDDLVLDYNAECWVPDTGRSFIDCANNLQYVHLSFARIHTISILTYYLQTLMIQC